MGEMETGTVKAWKEDRGMGFITPTKGGVDHFVHRSMLSDGQSLMVGATVSFVPNWDAAKDKPTATSVVGAIAAPAGGAPPPAPAWGAPPAQSWAAPAAPSGSAYGTVKAWIEARGMGFITPSDGSQDLFVHRSMLTDGQGLTVGSTVYFDPGFDAQKGKAIANNVTGCSQGQPAGYAPQAAPPAYGGPPQATVTSADNLYISGLPVDVTEESVRQIFGQYGVVTNVKVLPFNGGVDRVALVRMGAAEQARWLLENLNGNIPLGLQTVISVKFAQDKPKGEGKGFDKGAPPPPQQWQPWGAPAPPAWQQPGVAAAKGGGGKGVQSSDNLYIKGLPADSTTESVTALLGQYGTVLSCKVLDGGGQPDRVAMVKMSSPDEAKWLVENLDGNIPQGIDAVVQIKFSIQKDKGGGDKGAGKGYDGGYGAAPAWGAPPGKGASPYGGGPPPSYGGKGAPQMVATPKKDSLIITGLPADSTGESITALIGQYGTVTSAQMQGPGSALVTMGDVDTAKWLMDNLNGNIPQGVDTPIQIRFANNAPAAGGGGAPPPPSGTQATGTVKHWVEDRGMGFIAPTDGSTDCFCHRSNLMDGITLVPGSQVNFILGWDDRKGKPTANQVYGAVGGDGQGKGASKGKGYDGSLY